MEVYFQEVYHTEGKDIFKPLITANVNCRFY